MAEFYYEQSNFTSGELDPRTQARTDWETRYKSLKSARNVIIIPQGGFQNRWGTIFVDAATITDTTNPNYCELSTLNYEDGAIYLLVWEHANVNIYLENNLVANVATPYVREFIPNLRFTQIQNRIIVSSGTIVQKQLKRSASAPNLIANAAPLLKTFGLTNPITAGIVLPVTFTTTGNLPTTTPHIYENVTYFIYSVTTLDVKVFSTASDAANQTNAYEIANVGVGNNNIVIQNDWSLTDVSFKFKPTFDFTANYLGATVTFTPSAASGAVTITCANATPFTAAHVGGLYIGNGGIVRITAFTDTTHVDGYTIEPFPNTNAIRGDLSYLGEPAWSNARGWPRYSGFIQNRLVLAGNQSLRNGVWLSVINDVFNFDDSESLADNAISWYPESGNSTFIRAITCGRSLIVHCDNGSFSTPLLSDEPLTPSSFNLQKQDQYGISFIQPVFIDNQLYFVDSSGNNVVYTIWEIAQSSYVSGNKSIASSSLVNRPVDMDSFAQPRHSHSFFVLFINQDGTLCVHQTLLEQNINAWTLSNTQQKMWTRTDANNVLHSETFQSKYIRIITAQDRCWFTVQRRIITENDPININGVLASPVNEIVTLIPHGIPINGRRLARFTFVVLPGLITNPQVVSGRYYWVKATGASNLAIYATEFEASQDINRFLVTQLGPINNTDIVIGTSSLKLLIEELDFTVNTDSAVKYDFKDGVHQTVLTGLDHLNGQIVTVKGAGYVLPNMLVAGGRITLEEAVLTAEVGMQFIPHVEPLPISMPGAAGSLYKPKHIRSLYVNYYNTIGVTIQGFNMPVTQMQDIVLNQVPVPQTGIFNMTPMEGWDSSNSNIVIEQPLPLPMTILALTYKVDI